MALTGGSRGIGRAAARAFARAGFDVLIAARDAAALRDAEDEIASACPDRRAQVACVAADVSTAAGAAAVVAGAVARFGRLDVLVNDAGVAGPLRTPLWDVTEEDFRAVLEVNVTGAWRCASAAVRHAIAVGRPLRLVQVSSGIARGAVAGLGAYGASKRALEGLSAAFAADAAGAPVPITVVTVRPPSVRSAMTRAWMTRAEYEQLPGPEVVTPALLEAATAPRERVHGRVLRAGPGGEVEIVA